MIKVKHFMAPAEPEDGPRIWVETIGLTRDLRACCDVDLLLTQLGPRPNLWEWYLEHPGPYRYRWFKDAYHKHLLRGEHQEPLRELAAAGARQDLTLLHQCECADLNTATALRDLLMELAACPGAQT